VNAILSGADNAKVVKAKVPAFTGMTTAVLERFTCTRRWPTIDGDGPMSDEECEKCLREHGEHDWMMNELIPERYYCRRCRWRYRKDGDPLNGKTPPPNIQHP
jgi:hypothetical protein